MGHEQIALMLIGLLIKKLKDKGLLSVREIKEIFAETKDIFTKISDENGHSPELTAILELLNRISDTFKN